MCLKSPPGRRGGFFVLESGCRGSRPCTVRWGEERERGEGELDRQRPSAARRGTVPAGAGRGRAIWRAIRCARHAGEGRLTPATVVDHVVRTSRRPAAVLGPGQLAGAVQALPRRKTAREGRWGAKRGEQHLRRVMAAISTACRSTPRTRGTGRPPGGGHLSMRTAAGTGAPRAVYAREIREGGIRALSGGIREFLPARAHRIAVLL